MATVVELTPQELADLQAFTNEQDATAAIRRAMTEFLRFARRQRLKELSGIVAMEDNWTQLEASEQGDGHGNPGSRAG